MITILLLEFDRVVSTQRPHARVLSLPRKLIRNQRSAKSALCVLNSCELGSKSHPITVQLRRVVVEAQLPLGIIERTVFTGPEDEMHPLVLACARQLVKQLE